MRLVDKVALITQASDPFATAIAVGYAKEGGNLYLQDFSENRVKVRSCRKMQSGRTEGADRG
jgi:NADP-dependent 3-hydroxy acid dehydrogenase YdfG